MTHRKCFPIVLYCHSHILNTIISCLFVIAIPLRWARSRSRLLAQVEDIRSRLRASHARFTRPRIEITACIAINIIGLRRWNGDNSDNLQSIIRCVGTTGSPISFITGNVPHESDFSLHIFDCLITFLQLFFQLGSLIFIFISEIGQRWAWPSNCVRVCPFHAGQFLLKLENLISTCNG